MKTSLVRSACLATTAWGAFVGSPLYAQDDVDIVVTARRVEERLQDVPISITVFNQQQLTNRNIVSAGDLSTYTPSLTTNSRFGSESTSFALRGFTQEGPTSPSVGVYFAEVVSPRAQGTVTSGNGAGPGAFFDLQNVQVLKGPQGTLFGRNTTGGAVLLVPQKPTGRLEGYVEGSLGNYDMKRIQAVVNVPVLDTLRVRVGVDRQTRDGYLNNVSGVGPEDFGDTNYTAVRVSTVADLSPNLENYFVGSYAVSNTNGFMPRMFVVSNPTGYRAANYAAQIAATSGDYYNVANGSPYAFHHSKQWQLINTTTWRASDNITIKNIASYAEFRLAEASSIYGDSGLEPGSNPPAYHYAITIIPGPSGNTVAQSTFTEELQLQGRTPDDGLTYQLGAYLELAEPLGGFQSAQNAQFLRCVDIRSFRCEDVRGRSTPNGAGGNLEGRVGSSSFSQAKYRFRNLGLYAQGTFKLTDSLSVTAGVRYTSDVTSGLGQGYKANYPAPNTPVFSCTNPVPLVQGGTSAQIQADPTRCNLSRRVSSNKPTWLIDVDYKPGEDILLYAKYARGYRQGSINVNSYGLETWGPEKVDTYEIGAKTSFRGAVRGTFNVAAFYNDFSNQQLQVGTTACTAAELVTKPAQCPFLAVPTAGIANGGKSTIKGVEVDASITPFTGFTVDVGYAHLDTELKSITLPPAPVGFTALSTPPAGGPLPLTPRNKYSATASYSLPLDDNVGRIALAATFTHQDSSFGSPTSAPQFQWLPPQDNLNLNLNWNNVAGGPVDLGLFVTNVTKERFHLMTLGQSFGFDALITNQPRMFGARLKYRLGN
ncbi:MAG: TonB-dependent receptor [Sphingobium sp.]